MKEPQQYAPYSVGDTVVFMPSAFIDTEKDFGYVKTLRGCVIHVNAGHRYYTVEAECYGNRLRESFKF